MRGKRAEEEITDDKKHKNQINIDERIRDRKTQIRDREPDRRMRDRDIADIGIRDREIGINVD